MKIVRVNDDCMTTTVTVSTSQGEITRSATINAEDDARGLYSEKAGLNIALMKCQIEYARRMAYQFKQRAIGAKMARNAIQGFIQKLITRGDSVDYVDGGLDVVDKLDAALDNIHRLAAEYDDEYKMLRDGFNDFVDFAQEVGEGSLIEALNNDDEDDTDPYVAMIRLDENGNPVSIEEFSVSFSDKDVDKFIDEALNFIFDGDQIEDMIKNWPASLFDLMLGSPID